MREIGDAVDAKVTPLLDQEQQQKFQAMREEHRRELIEKVGGKLIEKLESQLVHCPRCAQVESISPGGVAVCFGSSRPSARHAGQIVVFTMRPRISQ